MELLANDLLSPTLSILLIIAAGFTSFITACLGVGGGLLLLVIMAAILPMAIVIPVHGLVQLGSNANRALLTFRYLDTKMLLYFAIGAVFGALGASLLVTELPLTVMKLLLGLFVIYILWATTPTIKETTIVGRITAGVVTTFLSMFVGASGPLVGSYLHMNNYDKLRFTATFSSCMTIQHGFKAVVFGAIGFAFWQWAPLIIAMISSGAIGTWFGIKLLKRIPTQRFKLIFKIILTLMSTHLIWQAAIALYHGA